jgi:hypothetical protein
MSCGQHNRSNTSINTARDAQQFPRFTGASSHSGPISIHPTAHPTCSARPNPYSLALGFTQGLPRDVSPAHTSGRSEKSSGHAKGDLQTESSAFLCCHHVSAGWKISL